MRDENILRLGGVLYLYCRGAHFLSDALHNSPWEIAENTEIRHTRHNACERGSAFAKIVYISRVRGTRFFCVQYGIQCADKQR